jgi:hydroxyacylglutathione hydrolase
MKIKVYPFGPLQANSYVVIFENDAFIIDPCVPLEILDLEGLHVRGIFCTHAHFDHIIEANHYREQLGCMIMVHEMDISAMKDSEVNGSDSMSSRIVVSEPLYPLRDNDVLTAQDFEMDEKNPFSITVMHTPGHTRGSICLLFAVNDCDNVLFSGDTIFAGTVGRTDLGGSMPDMIQSIRRISRLPDNVRIYPGHGESTSVGIEKSVNPYFTALSYNDII